MPSAEDFKRILAAKRAKPPAAPPAEPAPAAEAPPPPQVAKPPAPKPAAKATPATTTTVSSAPVKSTPKAAPPKAAPPKAAPVAPTPTAPAPRPRADLGTAESEDAFRRAQGLPPVGVDMAGFDKLTPEQRKTAAEMAWLEQDKKNREASAAGKRELSAVTRASGERDEALRQPANMGEAVAAKARPLTELASSAWTMVQPGVTGVLGELAKTSYETRGLEGAPGRFFAPSAVKPEEIKGAIVEAGDKAYEARVVAMQEHAAKEAERKGARFEDVYGDDPNMQAAKRLADTLRNEEVAKPQSANGKYLKLRTQQNLNEMLEARGGADAVTSGPEYDALTQKARDQAVRELVALRTVGQWSIPLTPREAAVGGGEADIRAFLPRQELRPGGSVVRTESLPGWFVGVPLSVLDAAALATVQGYDGDIQDRDLSTRFLENVRGRQDLVSYRIENDPELQADLSSGDPERVRSALLEIGPLLGLTIMTPDPVSAAGGVALAARRARQFVKYGSTLTEDLKAAAKAGDKVRVLEQAGAKFDELDAAAKVEQRLDKAAGRARAVVAQHEGGEDFATYMERVAKKDPGTAVLVRDAVARAAQADPDVRAYLDTLGDRATEAVRTGRGPALTVQPEDLARRQKDVERLAEVRAEMREIMKQYGVELEEAGAAALPGELVAKLATPRQEVAELVQRIKAVDRRVQNAQGAEKFEAVHRAAVAQVMDDLRLTTETAEGAPERVLSDLHAAPPRPTQAPVVDTGDLGAVTAAQMERLAGAQDPAEFKDKLARLPEAVRDAVARQLGFEDYDAFRRVASYTPEEYDKAYEAWREKRTALWESRSKAADELAALQTAPGQEAAYAAAKKAEAAAKKELAAAIDDFDALTKEVQKTAPAAPAAPDAGKVSKTEETLAKLRAELAEKQAEHAAERAALQADAKKVFLEDIANAEKELKKHEGDLDPQGVYVNGPAGHRIRTTAHRARLAEEELAKFRGLLTKMDPAKDAQKIQKTQERIDELVKLLDGDTREITAPSGEVYEHTFEKGLRQKLKEVQIATVMVSEKLERLRGEWQRSGGEVTPEALKARVEKLAEKHQKALATTEGAIKLAEEKLATKAAERAEKVGKASAAHEAAKAKLAAAQDRVDQARSAHEAALAAYQGTPKATKRVEGLKGAERIKAAQERAAKLEEQSKEHMRLGQALFRTPEKHRALAQALGAKQAEYGELATKLREREDFFTDQLRIAAGPEPVDPVVFLARDRTALADELDFIDRALRNENARRRGMKVVENIKNSLEFLYRPYQDILDASLQPHLRETMHRLAGELEDVGARLAAVVGDARPGDEALQGALDAVKDEVSGFKDAVLERQIPQDYVAQVLGAYLLPDVVVSEERGARLRQLLVDWAADPESTLTDLRNTLLDATRREFPGARMQMPQHGDIFLAQGVGAAAATRNTMRAMGFGAVTPEAARDINAVFADVGRGGGNPRAAIGRQRLIRMVIDPEDYRPVPHVGNAMPKGVQQPVAAAYTRATLPGVSPEKIADLRARGLAVLEAADDMFRQEVHVPLAVRDALQKQIGAVIATRAIPGEHDMALAFDYWRQAIIVGVGLSRPGQGWMDHFGDLLQTGARFPKEAAKTAFRSTLSQALHTPLMAQLAMVVDAIRKQPSGSFARDFDRIVARATFSPEIQKVLDFSDDVVGQTGQTGKQLGRIAREEGLYENLVTSQVTRSVLLHASRQVPRWLAVAGGVAQGAGAGLVAGALPGAFMGAIGGALFGATETGRRLAAANHAALVELSNTAANRRRMALYVSLIERGMEPRAAAKEAVKLVGAFSREISPVERSTITWWYPFFAYRKFNARRTLQVLSNPSFVKAINEAMSGGTLMASALLDDSDEYGFHSADMTTEPDPLLYDNLLERVSSEHPEWQGLPDQMARVQQAAEAEAAQLPRASERYTRMTEALRAMPYLKAKLYAYNPDQYRLDVQAQNPGMPDAEVDAITGQLVEDIKTLQGPYWAPDPVRAGLPDYLQDRYTILLNKARSQAMESYNRSSYGRSAKKGDESRFGVLPPDPNVDGLGTLLTAPAALSNLLTPTQGSAGADLFGVALRDPRTQSILDVAGMVDPNSPQDVAIPQQVGENLIAAGLGEYVEMRTPQETPYTGEPGQDPKNVRFVIPAKANAAMYLMPIVFGGALGAMSIMDARETVAGEYKTSGPADTVDKLGAYGRLVMGQKVTTVSPSAQEFFDRIEADKRVEAAMPSSSSGAPMVTQQATERQRAWTRLVTEDGAFLPENQEHADAVVERAKSGKTINDADMKYLRAYLAQSRPAAEVAALTDVQLVKAFYTPPARPAATGRPSNIPPRAP